MAIVSVVGGGESLVMSIAVAADGVADHVMPPSGTVEPKPPQPKSTSKEDFASEQVDVIAQGRRVRGLFPENASPNEVLYRADSSGRVTHYQTYDVDGLPIKRVDLVGATHGAVETPYVVEFDRHVNPRIGQTHVSKGRFVRPALPSELPPEKSP